MRRERHCPRKISGLSKTRNVPVTPKQTAGHEGWGQRPGRVTSLPGVELARQRTPVVSALTGLLVSWLSSLVYCDEFPF